MERARQHRPRRPAFLGPVALETYAGGPDPSALAEAAHATAEALVGAGRRARDPEVTARLVRLVDDHGLDLVADLWADRPARSLPGVLWRLYVLREWVRRDPAGVAADYGAGRLVAQVPRVVAGLAEPPTPEALRDLADAVLAGVFDGELDVALERAGAFCRVVATGRAHRADDEPEQDPADGRFDAAERERPSPTRSSAALVATAEDLEAGAALWRRHDLI